MAAVRFAKQIVPPASSAIAKHPCGTAGKTFQRMCTLKFSRRFIFSTVILILLTGCLGTATPAFTAEPPTAIVVEPSATPGLEAQPGASGIGDSLYPNLGNGGYDVQHYTLDLTVNDVATSDLNGKAIIDARATQNLSSLNFDFIGFEIKDITVNGQPAEFERSKQELIVTPSK